MAEIVGGGNDNLSTGRIRPSIQMNNLLADNRIAKSLLETSNHCFQRRIESGQCQDLAGVQDNWFGLIHYFKGLTACTVKIDSHHQAEEQFLQLKSKITIYYFCQ